METPSASAAQTAYKGGLTSGGPPRTVRITAAWHPYRDLGLAVARWELKTRPPHVVLHLPDGSGLRVPLEWTDASPPSHRPALPSLRFTADSLLALTRLVEALQDPHAGKSAGDEHGEDVDEAAVALERSGGTSSS